MLRLRWGMQSVIAIMHLKILKLALIVPPMKVTKACFGRRFVAQKMHFTLLHHLVEVIPCVFSLEDEFVFLFGGWACVLSPETWSATACATR